MEIKKLDWDSNFFNIKVGEVVNPAENTTILNDDFDLLYVKSNEDVTIAIPNFTMNFAEVKVIFSKEIRIKHDEGNSIFSIKETGYNIQEIYELAYESGKYSRFFLDKNFISEDFYRLYQKWVDNSISNIYADDLLVFLDESQIVGFVTYKSNESTATIGLIAVSPNQQGKGIGAKLLKHVENVLFDKQIKTLQIPTQESNQAACNFYTKQGYALHEKTFIKHFWKKQF